MDASKIDQYKKRVLNPKIDAMIQGLGQRVEAAVQAACPVKTGKLRASIQSSYDPETQTVSVYSDLPYARAVEMGHRAGSGKIVPAHPFLMPGLAAASGGSSMDAQASSGQVTPISDDSGESTGQRTRRKMGRGRRARRLH